jgi:hypothetical protein
MKIDLLTQNRSFYVGSRNSFKTSLGGILSIVFSLFLIVVTFFISYDFLFGTNPTLQKYSVVNRDDNWGNDSIQIMISYPKSLEGKSFLLERINDSDNYTTSSYLECSNGQYMYFSSSPKNSSLLYFCKNYTGYYNIEINLGDCNKVDKIERGHDEITTCGNESPSLMDFNDFTAYVGLRKFNASVVQKPIQKHLLVFSLHNGSNSIGIDFNNNKLENDLGVFFTDLVTEYFYSMDWSGMSYVDSFYYGHLQLHVNKNFVMGKTYIKLQEQIAQVIAMINILYLVFTFINWNDYFYCKYFLKLYIGHNIQDLKTKYFRGLKSHKIGNFLLIF